MPDKAHIAAWPGRAVHAALHPRASAGQVATLLRDNARWGWRLSEVVTRRARARVSSVLSQVADAGAGGMGAEEHLAVALHVDAEPETAPPGPSTSTAGGGDLDDLDDPLHLREADTSIDRAAADLEVDVTPLDVARTTGQPAQSEGVVESEPPR